MSLYSHSWHWNQSVSVHWSASFWLMCSSFPHPQHDTSTVALVLGAWFSNPYILSILISLFILFISLFFLSLTEDSIAQFQKKASIKVTFFHLFYFYFYDLAWQKKGLSCWWSVKTQVISRWPSRTYGGAGGPRGPKSLWLSGLQL